MDIIITGDQGAGKTCAAETLLSTFRPAYGTRFAPRDILTIDYYVFGDTAGLLKTLVQSRCRAVLFDGCFTSPNDLLIACEAVKEYRKQINTDVLAIYIDLGFNVMVTNGAGCTCSVPEILPGIATDENVKELRDALGMEGPRLVGALETASKPAEPSELRTVTILRDLWAKAIDAGHEAAAYQRLSWLLNGTDRCSLSDLDSEERINMHAYLLDLLNNNEQTK